MTRGLQTVDETDHPRPLTPDTYVRFILRRSGKRFSHTRLLQLSKRRESDREGGRVHIRTYILVTTDHITFPEPSLQSSAPKNRGGD